MKSNHNLSEIAQTIRNINYIIERDSKSSTYKFALLRATIEIIGEQSPYIQLSEKEAVMPMGLLIEKWMLYYYPLLLNDNQTPQNTGDNSVVFFQSMQLLHKFYENKAGKGLSIFYNDLRYKGIPESVNAVFTKLSQDIRKALVTGPMYHIGHSIEHKHNSIYKPLESSNLRVSTLMGRSWLIQRAGTFSIPRSYYDVFHLFGSFITGENTLIMHWADFSAKLSNDNSIKTGSIISQMLESPTTEHDVKDARKIYSSLNQLTCIWTSKSAGSDFEVDHLIPFSIWKNNDLWNLLPASRTANNQKRDKIPSIRQLEKSKVIIFEYWELLKVQYPERFEQEFRIALLGEQIVKDWKEAGFEKIKESCQYLVNIRGFELWK